MSTPIIPVVTAAGIQAALDAQGNGLQVEITELALGADSYVPSLAQTALSDEQQRVAVAGPTALTPGQLHLAAVVSGPEEYWISELGFFDSNGVLFAVWSDPQTPLAYKAAAVDVTVAFDVALNSVDPSAVTVITTNTDPTLTFLAEQGVQNTRLDALEASPGGGTDPADQARITALETNDPLQDTAIAAPQAQDIALDGRLDTLEAAPPGGGSGTDPADQARITALETSQTAQDGRLDAIQLTEQVVQDNLISNLEAGQVTQDNRLDALEATGITPSDIGAANRFYATRHLSPFCGGALNTPLAHDAGGVTAPYAAVFLGGSAGTATIEVVAIQDTARLSALGISRTSPFLNLSVSPFAVDFNIVVIDAQFTTAPSTGAIFHLSLAALPFLNSGPANPNVSNDNVNLTAVEVGAWVNAMQIDVGFELCLGWSFSAATVGSAAVGSSWQYLHAVSGLNPSPGLFFHATSAQPAGGVCKAALALPYLGFGNHGGGPVWVESIKDVIDGL